MPSTNTSTDELDRISVIEKNRDTDKVKTIQSRPLPQVPGPGGDNTAVTETDNTDNNINTPKLQMR